MLSNRTERATTKTTAHDVDAKTDHFPRRDLGGAVMTTVFIRVNRMRTARIRKIKYQIHFCGGQRNRRRIDPDIARGSTLAVRLDKSARIPWVSLQMQHAIGMCKQNGIRFDLLVGRQADHTSITRRDLELAFGLQGGIRLKEQW